MSPLRGPRIGVRRVRDSRMRRGDPCGVATSRGALVVRVQVEMQPAPVGVSNFTTRPRRARGSSGRDWEPTTSHHDRPRLLDAAPRRRRASADRSARRVMCALRACAARRARSSGARTLSGSTSRSKRSRKARRPAAVRSRESWLAWSVWAATRARRLRSEAREALDGNGPSWDCCGRQSPHGRPGRHLVLGVNVSAVRSRRRGPCGPGVGTSPPRPRRRRR